MTTQARGHVTEVEIQALDPARLEPLIGLERMERFNARAAAAEKLLAGRRVFNVNSTAVGGGVAEMLQTLLAYARGAGIDTRWLVIDGDPEFFEITKRIHNGLYGGPGDGGQLDTAARQKYEAVMERNAGAVAERVRPGEFVILHDPQTAGLTQALQDAGARVIWRCHVGHDSSNEWTERAWAFLRPYLESADAFVFSRANFAPAWVDADRIHLIPPSLDPFSAKNQPMSARNVRPLLGYVGLLDGALEPPRVPFTRRDGTLGKVRRFADVLQNGPSPPAHAPMVLQASRWDRVKDMTGVMMGFAEHVDPSLGAHLVLTGPAVYGVADDPEASQVLVECMVAWAALPHESRNRIHLSCIPMADPDEAAAIVNALQRHASIVVQKSLAEGFGLTVTEGMWKSRPIVASAVGGIVDQIADGENGLLLDDPHDLAGFGAHVEQLLIDTELAQELGRNGRQRVIDEFLGDRHLGQYGRLFEAIS
ncbi:MAG: glycosyltransferase [Thermoleophilia bacterium]|nr:glycosyltransferase [Thermoleophilia bacterium]